MVRFIAKIISLIMLVALMVPPFLFFGDQISLDRAKMLMNVVTVIWFITASVWMWRREPSS